RRRPRYLRGSSQAGGRSSQSSSGSCSSGRARRATPVIEDLLKPPVTVAVNDLHVKFRVATAKKDTGSGSRKFQAFRRVLGMNPKATVRALRGLSLVAREGESVGIVGQNGSGKSTLLRTIAGLQEPSRGEVHASSE